MRDCYALRSAGRATGIQDVGQIVECWLRPDLVTLVPGEQRLDINIGGASFRHDGCDARLGPTRIDRDVSRAYAKGPQDGRNSFGRSIGAEGDSRTRSDPGSSQASRNLIGAPFEFPVRDARSARDNCGDIWILFRLLLEEQMHAARF